MAQVKKRVGVDLVSFLARPKPRIPFHGLSLLRNQTETLAKQTIDPRSRFSSKPSRLFFFFSDHWSDQLFQNNQHFQAIEFLDQPVPEKLDMGFLFYGHEVLQVECVDSQVQSYSYITHPWHICNVWQISTDPFLASHVKARKFESRKSNRGKI